MPEARRGQLKASSPVADIGPAVGCTRRKEEASYRETLHQGSQLSRGSTWCELSTSLKGFSGGPFLLLLVPPTADPRTATGGAGGFPVPPLRPLWRLVAGPPVSAPSVPNVRSRSRSARQTTNRDAVKLRSSLWCTAAMLREVFSFTRPLVPLLRHKLSQHVIVRTSSDPKSAVYCGGSLLTVRHDPM